MAKIYRAYNPLKNEFYKSILFIVVLWFFALFFLSFLEVLEVLPYFGFFVLSFVSLFTSFLGRKVKVTLSGLNGESDAAHLTKRLPSDYTVFSNVTIRFDEKESETDLIIVCENGVFLIEVKNHLGIITGQEKDRNWVQFKETRNGGKYVNPFYNPTKQVKTHVYRLSSVLKNKNFGGWLQGVVYFSNPSAQVKCATKNIPVFTNEEDLTNYIVNFKPRNKVSAEEISLIIETIKEQIVIEHSNVKKIKKARSSKSVKPT